MRQRLGLKKHKLCENIGKKKYDSCFVRGNTTHYVALCSYQQDGKQYTDAINYKTRQVLSDYVDPVIQRIAGFLKVMGMAGEQVWPN